jgi:tetratricopeptide (TPR) repeat protein
MKPKQQHTGPLRRWLMGLMLVFMVPVILLASLELVLRAIGTGHSTSFFLRETIGEESFLRSNHQFTFNFFPGALARSVLPERIRIPKPRDTYRILIFGESAANGDPDPAYGFGRHLEILLEERFPGTEVEVVNTAITAINSHVILPIARDSVNAGADLWIIYMGNNEMIGPFGAGTVFGSRAPPLPLVRASLAVRETRIGQLMKAVAEGIREDPSTPGSWEGINMFTENLLRPDDPKRLRVYGNFRANLQEILKAAERAEVPVLLSTVGSNLRDCAPFASLHSESLSSVEIAEWNRHFEAGKAFEAEKRIAEALDEYGKAAAIDPGYAELQFRIGRCHGLSGNLELARHAMEKALDADALVVRADATINNIIREVATRQPPASVTFVDAAGQLAAASPAGIPGKELFYEHVHFTLMGNFQLARIFGEHVLQLLPAWMTNGNTTGTWVDPGFCQRKLAATLWDKARLWTSMRERQSHPPFTSREGNAANISHCNYMAGEFKRRINTKLDRLVYERALAENPDDYLLHARFGDYLLLNGDLEAAIEILGWVTERFPDFEGGHQQLGIAYMAAERYPEATASFQRVLEINPDYNKAQRALRLIRERTPQN